MCPFTPQTADLYVVLTPLPPSPRRHQGLKPGLCRKGRAAIFGGLPSTGTTTTGWGWGWGYSHQWHLHMHPFTLESFCQGDHAFLAGAKCGTAEHLGWALAGAVTGWSWVAGSPGVCAPRGTGREGMGQEGGSGLGRRRDQSNSSWVHADLCQAE